MHAALKNYRQAPRKVRRVSDLLRGKKISDALVELNFIPKRSAAPIKKLLASAVANAEKNLKKKAEDLYIKSITVDKGLTLKRIMPRSRGMANPIHKHSSHVRLVLAPLSERKSKNKSNKQKS